MMILTPHLKEYPFLFLKCGGVTERVARLIKTNFIQRDETSNFQRLAKFVLSAVDKTAES